MRLFRQALRAVLALTAILAGCNSPGLRAMYGPVPAYGMERPPGDSTVEIVDFTYEPANPVTAGDGILFTATLNKQFSSYWGGGLEALIGNEAQTLPGYASGISIPLYDDGGLYDAVAGDLIYSGAIEWRADWGVAEGLPVIAKLDWWDDTPDVIFTGEPLTVVVE